MKTNIIKPLNNSLGGVACASALMLTASASAQNLFVSNYTSQNVDEYTPGGGQSTFATGLNYPLGIAFNGSGDLFVANTSQNAGNSGSIIEFAPNGAPTTFATGLDPIALAVNGAGNVFAADYNSGNIYEYSPSGVFLSTFASGFMNPLSLAFDSTGNLFVGSGYGNGNGVITKITSGGVQSPFASGLSFPLGLAFNSAGNLFESDNASDTIYEFTPGGVQSTFATVSSTGGINGLAFNNAGNLFISTGFMGSIVEITPGGKQSTFVADAGDPAGLAFQPVPEPTTIALLGIGAAAFFARRRR